MSRKRIEAMEMKFSWPISHSSYLFLILTSKMIRKQHDRGLIIHRNAHSLPSSCFFKYGLSNISFNMMKLTFSNREYSQVHKKLLLTVHCLVQKYCITDENICYQSVRGFLPKVWLQYSPCEKSDSIKNVYFYWHGNAMTEDQNF